MAEKTSPGQITRRNFLGIAGAAAGSLMIPSSLLAFGRNASAAGLPAVPSMKIGLLLPSSGIYPALADNIRDGLLAGFGDKAKKPEGLELLIEDIGTGGLSSAPKAGRLVRQERVDLVIAFVNARVAESIDLALMDEKTPLVIANIGEHMIRDRRRPETFHNTLHYWQAQWAMGRWAAGQLGKKAYVSSSVYESGYDSLYAFRLGLESAGGKVLDTDLGLHGSGAEALPLRMGKIERSRPDFVFALHSGRSAADFLRAYSASGLAGKIPLAGGAFLVGEGACPDRVHSALDIRTCFSWTPELNNQGNPEFISACGAAAGRGPDAFSLLGYDTALMIRKALADAGGRSFNSARFLEALRSVRYDSPRGAVRMSPESAATAGPLYLSEVRLHGGRVVNASVKETAGPSGDDPRILDAGDSLVSGWHNAYMCV